MGDAMKGSLFVLGSTTFLTCLASGAFAQDAPATTAPPTAVAISEKMAGVTGELSKKVTGKPVQTEQKGIVRDLDLLIASLEKECQNCKGNMSPNNPTKPAQDSIIKRGTGGIGDLVDPGQSQKDWAKLSGRERDRILQSMSEGFPPEYRTVLERYYRRLAEEKTVASGADSAASKEDAADSAKPSKSVGGSTGESKR
jgi:hypothetical protein